MRNTRDLIISLLALTISLSACAPARQQYQTDRESSTLRQEKAVLKQELASLQKQQNALLEQMRILQDDLDSARRGKGTSTALAPSVLSGASPIADEAREAGQSSPNQQMDSVSDQIIAVQAYQTAFAAFATSDYPNAEQRFKDFSTQFPTNRFAGNAIYWQARSMIAQGNTLKGAERLKTVAAHYPDSGKAPEALATLALLYSDAGETEQAIETEETLRLLYPYSTAARRLGNKTSTGDE